MAHINIHIKYCKPCFKKKKNCALTGKLLQMHIQQDQVQNEQLWQNSKADISLLLISTVVFLIPK